MRQNSRFCGDSASSKPMARFASVSVTSAPRVSAASGRRRTAATRKGRALRRSRWRYAAVVGARPVGDGDARDNGGCEARTLEKRWQGQHRAEHQQQPDAAGTRARSARTVAKARTTRSTPGPRGRKRAAAARSPVDAAAPAERVVGADPEHDGGERDRGEARPKIGAGVERHGAARCRCIWRGLRQHTLLCAGSSRP